MATAQGRRRPRPPPAPLAYTPLPRPTATTPKAEASLSSDVGVRFLQGAAEALPFADATFDLVVSSMSFHHWADQRTGLGEVRRVLATGGLRLAFGAAGTRGRFHTPAELDAMLDAQGLTTIGRGVLPRMGSSVQVVVSRADSTECR